MKVAVVKHVAVVKKVASISDQLENIEGEDFERLIERLPLQDDSLPFIVGFNGQGGRGKSAAMTLYVGLYRSLIRRRRKGKNKTDAKIYTNYINRWADYYDPDMLQYALNGYLPNGEKVTGGLLALDEIQQGGDRRRWNSKVNMALSNDLVGQLRKRPLHLAWTAQMMHHIESRVLERTNLFVMVNRKPGTHLYRFAVYDYNGMYTKPRKYRLPLTGDDASWYFQWHGTPLVYQAYRHDQQVASLYGGEEEYRNMLHREEEARLGERISNVRTFDEPGARAETEVVFESGFEGLVIPKRIEEKLGMADDPQVS